MSRNWLYHWQINPNRLRHPLMSAPVVGSSHWLTNIRSPTPVSTQIRWSIDLLSGICTQFEFPLPSLGSFPYGVAVGPP